MAAARKPNPKPPARRAPIAEWASAAVGLLLTLAVLGVTIWELVADPGEPPRLVVAAEGGRAAPGGWLVQVSVRNESFATAADVEIEGVQMAGGVEESRSATFPYVPARGRAKGSLVFPQDPTTHPVALSVRSFRDP